jgi:hypothetical protein
MIANLPDATKRSPNRERDPESHLATSLRATVNGSGYTCKLASIGVAFA